MSKSHILNEKWLESTILIISKLIDIIITQNLRLNCLNRIEKIDIATFMLKLQLQYFHITLNRIELRLRFNFFFFFFKSKRACWRHVALVFCIIRKTCSISLWAIMNFCLAWLGKRLLEVPNPISAIPKSNTRIIFF